MKKIKIVLNDDRFINLTLDENIAPITVKNFMDLVEKKYFDNTIFHRVIDNFMIQTGGYYIDGSKLKELGHLEPIKGEFLSNGVNNSLKHTTGVISMARTNVPDSATSQFFICAADCPHLDGHYAAFGQTDDEESINTVLEIARVKTKALGYQFNDFPETPITIKTIEIR